MRSTCVTSRSGQRRAHALRCAGWALLVLAAHVAAVWLAFGDAIARNFQRPQWEDGRFFHYTATRVHSLADAFALGSYWPGLYRPLSTNVYYWLGRLAWHDDLGTYHAINVALFVVNGLLAYQVCRTLLSRGLSLLVSLLLCTRSASVEVVLYSSQMQSLLPAFFSLLALWAYLRAGDARRGRGALFAAAAAATLLALLSKEAAVTLPFVLPVFWLARRSRGAADVRPQLLGALGSLAAAGVWFAIAYRRISIVHNPNWHYVFKPLALAGNYVAYVVAAANVLVNPVHLVRPAVRLDNYPAIMAAHASAESRVALILAVIACVVVLALRQGGWRRPSDRAALAAASFLGFVLILAPYVVLKDRRLMYYGYFAYFPLALAAVSSVEVAAVAIAKRVLPLPRWRHLGAAASAPEPGNPGRGYPWTRTG